MKARIGLITKSVAALGGLSLLIQWGHAEPTVEPGCTESVHDMGAPVGPPQRIGVFRGFLYFSFETWQERAQGEISQWASIESTNLETL